MTTLLVYGLLASLGLWVAFAVGFIVGTDRERARR